MNESGKTRTRRPGWFYRAMMSLIGLFDRWLHMSCRSFIQVASEKHERQLGQMERLRQGLHRAMCRICRIQERRMDQLRTLALEVGRSSVDEIEMTLSPEVSERIRSAMSRASSQSSPSDPTTH